MSAPLDVPSPESFPQLLGLLPWRFLLMSSPRLTLVAQGLQLHILSSLLPHSLDLLRRDRGALRLL